MQQGVAQSNLVHQITKESKNCVTKLHWDRFFQQFGEPLSKSPESKPLEVVFKCLRNDKQCLNYPQKFWTTLLEGCLSSWNLDLGKRICEHTLPIASTQILILSADIYLQSGSPAKARSSANRALRLKKTKPWEKLQLQIIVCNAYVEDGKHSMAHRLLEKIEETTNHTDLKIARKADVYLHMARAQFFLGRYLKAASNFFQSYELFLEVRNWEGATKGLFNTAACYHNAGHKHQNKALMIVQECKLLAEKQKLEGPLSHCHAFFGTCEYQNGQFLSAAKHYKLALKTLPSTDNSFRKLHIVSMLSLTYLKMGKYSIGSRYGNQTLTLASQDKSERFKSRYINLEAELLWKSGQMQKSHKILNNATIPLLSHGVNTLEELSTISRYLFQLALVGKTPPQSKITISETLKESTVSWLEYLYSKAQLEISNRKYSEALKLSRECLEKAEELGSKYFQALAHLTTAQAKSAQIQFDQQYHESFNLLVEAIQNMGETPLRMHLSFFRASQHYHNGEFDQVRIILSLESKSRYLSAIDKALITSWLSTINGNSPRLNDVWQSSFVARATKIYFSPSLEYSSSKSFIVSNKYTIDLHRHPVLDLLLRYLMEQKNYTASVDALQKNVWGQSLSARGFKQKIRNTIMRMRDSFPYTVSPLILHSDNQVRLFSEAIKIETKRTKKKSLELKILTNLESSPMSTKQLMETTNSSSSTLKRALKKLAIENQIFAYREGRNITYHTLDRNQKLPYN